MQEKLSETMRLKQRIIDDVSSSSCVDGDRTPKVAMMFMSYGKLHNEPIWRAFFEAAGRLCLKHEPPANLTAAPRLSNSSDVRQQSPLRRRLHSEDQQRVFDCSSEEASIESEVERLTAIDWNATDLVARQSLFTVYVNSKAYDDTEEPSIFTEHVISRVMNTENGYAQFTLVAATLRLLQAALENPLNRKFVLLSESCVPIHPPELIHAQLVTEPRSRLNACRHGNRNLGRWNHKIVDYKVWRKSSQFIALKRSHASLAADDAELSARFQQYCFTTWDPIRNLCVADEHYFPTLIAYHGLENQTDCQGYVTSSEWDTGRDPWHPVSYEEDAIHPELFRRLAENGKALQECKVDIARASVAAIYEGFTGTGCIAREADLPKKTNSTLWMVKKGFYPLLYPCPLFSRKFSVDVVRKTLSSALSCNGTGLGYWCY